MPKKLILNDINTLLEMTRDQVQIIESYNGKIPQIELDIIMSNIRRLYDDFYELNIINRQIKAENPGIDQSDIEEEPQQELVTIISKVITTEEPIREAVKEVVPAKEDVAQVPVHKPEPAEEPQKEEQIAVAPIKKIEETKVPTDLFGDTENYTLADKYRDEKKTFHDKISGGNKDKTIADTLQKPISDLRTGIGVNDRFVFINELFGGSMADYQAAIEEINRQGNFEAATLVITQYKQVLNWKEDSGSLSKLMGFVKRRFC